MIKEIRILDNRKKKNHMLFVSTYNTLGVENMTIKIYIDQGHNMGNVNGGASGFNLWEAEITYNVGRDLANLLRLDPRFEVRTSRSYLYDVVGSDTPTSLATRVEEANSWPADYFISIHANSNTDPLIHGSEVYIYQNDDPADFLAQDVLDSMVFRVGTKDNGVRVNPTLYVLRNTTMPAILVELAYLSNYRDSQKLRFDQPTFAYAIYIGILRFFRFYEDE